MSSDSLPSQSNAQRLIVRSFSNLSSQIKGCSISLNQPSIYCRLSHSSLFVKIQSPSRDAPPLKNLLFRVYISQAEAVRAERSLDYQTKDLYVTFGSFGTKGQNAGFAQVKMTKVRILVFVLRCFSNQLRRTGSNNVWLQ